jgi:hypothetical protein
MRLHRALCPAAACVLLLAACDFWSPSEPSSERLLWLQAMIAEILSQPPTNPPSAIYRYRYHGQVVYYRTGYCCDVPSSLYDEAGNLLCHPDGGFTGDGDGRCPDFHAEATTRELVWQDPR